MFGKTLYRWWMKFALLLGTINGFLILSIFYLVIIGIYAIPMRLLRKKQTHTVPQWQKKEVIVNPRERVQYQF